MEVSDGYKEYNSWRIFISQPMKGLSKEEILKKRHSLANKIRERANGTEVEVINSYFTDNPSWTALDYLAESIKCLGKANLVVFTEGWEEARGCRIEHEICREYGISYMEEMKDSFHMWTPYDLS